jgi:1,4-alpha-glucan branching enzyme
MTKEAVLKKRKPQPVDAKQDKEDGVVVKAGVIRRKRVTFIFDSKPCFDVRLAGSFNNWDPTSHVLGRKSGNRPYTATVLLPKGRHEYKFVVDGQWLCDPGCENSVPDGHGARNSVIEIG